MAQEGDFARIEQRLRALEKTKTQARPHLKGLIQFNTAIYQIDDDLNANERPDLEGGAHFRRVRYDAQGPLGAGFSYRLQVEYGGERLALKNVHLNYDLENAQIRVGKTKVPQAHEELMSSTDSFFVERSLVNQAFKLGRKAGVEIRGHIRNRFTYHTGIYTNGSGHRRPGERAPLYSALRLSAVPFEDGPALLHIGGHFIHSTGEKGARFRTGPESRVAHTRMIDTSALGHSHRTHRYGAELMTLFSDWRLSYEYRGVDVQKRNVSFSGHIVEAATNLTGERREYSYDSGVLKGLIPNNPYSSAGLGALELALRASWIDLNNSPTTEQGVAGGKGLALAANLAWIPVKNIVFAAEVGRLDIEQVSGLADQEVGQYQLKAQVSF